MKQISIQSPNVTQTAAHTDVRYTYSNVIVREDENGISAEPFTRELVIRTEKALPKTGVMIIGIGGNNGTTVCAGLMANKRKLTWETKEGIQESNWYGSLTQASTMRIGTDATTGMDRFMPLKDVVPFVNPEDWIVGGWDISKMPLGDAMRRAKVMDISLQNQVYEDMQKIVPLPSIYIPEFIALNQSDRADNTLTGTIEEMLATVREQIKDFKTKNALDKVVIIWSGNTEKMCPIEKGVNDTARTLMDTIKANNIKKISPSTIYCVASILEGCSYINGSPQNTFVPGVVDLALLHGVFLGGDDFKSGQTKVKSTLVDFLISAGVKPRSIVSYNHLGNNDGVNLSQQDMFRSKEISKSSVVDDMVQSNQYLYPDAKNPDHVVVIKYVPYVGDSKRALDEYTSEIFMGGKNTIVVHNTCEDSLLAAPLIVDLVVITEFCERLSFSENQGPFERMHSVLSILSYLCKAPKVPDSSPVVNSLFRQREAIMNVLRATVGLPPDNNMLLEHKLKNFGKLRLNDLDSDIPMRDNDGDSTKASNS
eukprot:GHVO01010345.1.p1 GENE.GHVO01010345.1~~GHVO01010345.1.p1  ORF type:complete len:538 (+),score=93.89 GHVO01010345.1:416-2029(+)